MWDQPPPLAAPQGLSLPDHRCREVGLISPFHRWTWMIVTVMTSTDPKLGFLLTVLYTLLAREIL